MGQQVLWFCSWGKWSEAEGNKVGMGSGSLELAVSHVGCEMRWRIGMSESSEGGSLGTPESSVLPDEGLEPFSGRGVVLQPNPVGN